MKTLPIIILLFLTVPVFSQVTGNTSVETRLRFLSDGKNINLEVILDFSYPSDSVLVINGFKRYFGDRPGNFLTRVTGHNGTRIQRKQGTDSMEIKGADDRIRISYILAYDSAALSGNTFAANVGEHHFHAAFYQWMLPLSGDRVPLVYHIRVSPLPSGWKFYNSVSGEFTEFSINGSMSNNFSRFIGAGNFFRKQYLLYNKPVTVFINNEFEIGNEKLADMVFSTLRYQHTLFRDSSFNFFNVAVLPKPDNVAGFATTNMFMCYVRTDVQQQRIAWLLMHEIAHRWVGRWIGLKTSAVFPLRHQWFKEGIDDYLAYYALLDSKRYTPDEFVNGINLYLRNIEENPFATFPEDSMIRVANTGRYGVQATQLPYYKGMLIGLLADLPFLRDSSGGYSSRMKLMLLHLYKKAISADTWTPFDESEFFAIADSMQLPLKTLYRKHIINGEVNFDLPDTLFGKYILELKTYARFSKGFSEIRKAGKRIISGVDLTGAAFQAGLRNDMELLSESPLPSYIPFGKYASDYPVTVLVLHNGQKKTIQFLPKGEALTVKQYRKL